MIVMAVTTFNSRMDSGALVFFGPLFLFFLGAIFLLRFMAKEVNSSVWKVTPQNSGLIVHTLSEEKLIPWNSIENIERQACGDGRYVNTLTLSDKSRLQISEHIDKTGELFKQIREKSNLSPYKRYEMRLFLQIQSIAGLPVALMFFGLLLAWSHPIVYWGISIFCLFYLLFMCMFLSLSCEVSETGLKIRSLLANCETDWSGVRESKLSTFLRTPQGGFLLSLYLPDFDLMRKTIHTHVANEKNIRKTPLDLAEKKNLGQNKSGRVVWFLSLVSLLAPLPVSAYSAPVAVSCAVFDFLLGKTSFLRTGLCLVMSVPAIVALFTISHLVSPNSPGVMRLIEANSPGFDVAKYMSFSEPIDLFGYEISPPANCETSLDASKSGQLKKWFGKGFFATPNEITFMVADEHKGGQEGKERYEWSHPFGLANIERVGSAKEQVGGLEFTVNQWKATSGMHKVAGFDYIANDNKLMVAMRSYDVRESDARARANSVMQSFRKVSNEGIPKHAAPIEVQAKSKARETNHPPAHKKTAAGKSKPHKKQKHS